MALRLVVPCTKTKRLPPDRLALRSVQVGREGTLDDVMQAWQQRLTHAFEGARLPARELYQGNQWRVIQQARCECPAHLHILSAGLGLVGEDDPIPGYGATFSRGMADSIPALGEPVTTAHQHWWQMLGQRPLPGRATPQTLSRLMCLHPDDDYLLVASPPYVNAVLPDLIAGASYLSASQRLLVVTSGAAVIEGLPLTSLLRSEAGMRPILGGGMTTLNIRLAARVMKHYSGSGSLNDAAREAVSGMDA